MSRALGTLVLSVIAVLAATARAQDLSQPGPLLPARRDVTVVRADGTTFTSTVHYPGTAAGVGTAVDVQDGPYPIVAFGHGFVCPVSLYQSTGAHLASWGFVVIMPQTQGSLLPSHPALAADMRSALDWLASEGATASSPWAGAIAADRRGVMGHSMGGGCALLAASQDPRIRAAVPMAAADTNPSSVAASASVRCATRLVAGSQDTIVPPSTNAPMFSNLPGPAQLVTITGGFHCGFVDSAIVFCDSGSITRAQQLSTVRREATEFLLLYLRGESSLWGAVWDAPPPGDGVAVQSHPTADLDGDGRIGGPDLALLLAGFGAAGRGDLDLDGSVGGADIALLLGAWTG